MGVLDSTYGAALDPQTMGLLSAAFAGLEASGPSRMPVSLGQVVGRAGQSGLNTYAGALNSNRQNAQTEAMIALEKQKAALTGSQVEQAAYQQRLQQWALGGMQGPPPSPGGPPTGMPGMQPPGMQPPGVPQGMRPPGMQPPGMPQSAPQPQPGMMPVGAQPQQPMPMGAPQPMGPQAGPMPAGGPMQGVPDYLQKAAMFKTAGLPAIGEAIGKANEPVVGREGGIYKRDATGNLALDPGWLAGERQRMELQKGIEDQHTMTEVPLADGRKQTMTKAQQLAMVNGTATLKNAMPWASDELTANFQRQMLASPGKDIPINISVGGRDPVHITLPALNKRAEGGMPGMTSGQSTEARAAQEASGKEAGGIQAQIDSEASGALQSRKILGEMRTLSGDFTQGKVAPFKRALGEYAQALNLPGDWAAEIKSAESQQALKKLTAQMATAAMKQMTNRGTQMEFKTFLENNPNAELTPGGFQKVLEFMDKSAQTSLDRQQAYQEWKKTNPVERSQDFLSEWNKKQSDALSAPSSDSQKFPSAPLAAINRLKMKPSEKAQFDAIFGPGAADRALGK